jgi:hypothetical protein
MSGLAAQLEVRANLDLTDLFGTLASDVMGVSFGGVSFDASGVVGLASGATRPDLGSLHASVQGTLSAGSARLDLGIPGASLPAALLELTSRLPPLGSVVPDPTVPDLVGLAGLEARLNSVRETVKTGALGDLLGAVPGLGWPDLLGRVGGDLGGLLGLLRSLAGLAAMATSSRRLVDLTERFAGLLDADTAVVSGAALTAATSDLGLVNDIRTANPTDTATTEALAVRVAAFADAVTAVGDSWAAGMAFGEAALPLLDVAGAGAAVELARVALTAADPGDVAALVAEIMRIGAPLLDLPLPDPSAFAEGFVKQASDLVDDLTATVQTWDAVAAVHPITDVASMVTRPIHEIHQALAAVDNEVTSALYSLRSLVDELDLTPIATVVHETLRPVTDLLDAVERDIDAAQATLAEVAGNINTALGNVADLISRAAGQVTSALGSVNDALDELDLQKLADDLGDGLRSVGEALASAQLTPYFDTAIDVIETSADVVDAVPFGMLPTDIQQEIVDACKPIKALDLTAVEDTLRGELASVKDEFKADALAAIQQAYAEVVAFLESLDPTPFLVDLESGPLAEVRATLDSLDPAALLAPVDEVLNGMRGLLAGLDLERDVMAPLRDLFAPVLEAIDSLDPTQLLGPAQAQVDEARESLTSALHLDAVNEALASLHDRAAGMLSRIDPLAMAAVLDQRAAQALAELPGGPPGGGFGSLLVSVAETSGFRADEESVQDVVSWVRGDQVGGDVVKARLQLSAGRVAAVREAVAALDPAPLAASAAAYRVALSAAVAIHPADSLLRTALEPLVADVAVGVLASLAENRRRYQVRLDADVPVLNALAASGRSEVTEAATRLHVALAPLGAFPARLNALLASVGLDPAGRSFRQVLLDLLSSGQSGLVEALARLVSAALGKVTQALDAVIGSGQQAVDSVTNLLSLLDLAPLVGELTGYQQQVRDEVAAVTPDNLLGGVVAEALAVLQRLHDFDPLAPVRQVIDGARKSADEVFESARPTVVFAPVVKLQQTVTGLAKGLDVLALLTPILDALDALAGQLDSGFDRTGDALTDLQGALPSEVSDSPLGGAVSADIGVSV